MKKLLALLTAAVATLTSAWAATPVAVWDGFTGADGELTKGDYSWTKSANTTVEDGKLVIGSDGGLTMTTPTTSAIYTDRTVTIVMDVEDIPDGDVTLYGFANVQTQPAATNRVSLDSNNGNIYQHWNRGGSYGNATFNRTISHRIAYTYQGARGVGSTTYVDGTQSMFNTGLQASSGNITTLFVGNYFNGTAANIAEGMKISRIALFDSKLSAAEVAAYEFGYEGVAYTCTVDGETATWYPTLGTIRGGDTIEFTGTGTVSLPEGAAKANITIGADVTLVLSGGSISKSFVTNNGTIKVVGGTLEEPVTINEDGSANTGIGKVVIAENSVAKIHATGGNKLYNVTGASADSSTLLMTTGQDWGMTDGTSIRNCKVVINHAFWWERNTAFDATVDFDIGNSTVNFGYQNESNEFAIRNITGTGTIAPTGAPTLVVNPTAGSEFAGTCNAKIKVASGTFKSTKENGIGSKTIELTENTSLVVPAELAAGKVITNVAGKMVSFSSTTKTYSLVPIAATVNGTPYASYDAAKAACTDGATLVITADITRSPFAKAADHANIACIEIAEGVTVTGFMPDSAATVPLKINGTLKLIDGYTGDNRAAIIPVLSGTGTIEDGIAANRKGATPTIKIKESADWEGSLVYPEAEADHKMIIKFSLGKNGTTYYFSNDEIYTALRAGTEVTKIGFTSDNRMSLDGDKIVLNTYTVTLKEFEHTTIQYRLNQLGEKIAYTGAITVKHGDRVDYEYVADEGYEITSVTANLRFSNVTGNITVAQQGNVTCTVVATKTPTELFLEAINGDATEVTLTGDVAIESMITLEKSFAINLDGHTLSFAGDTAKTKSLIQVVNEATLTINGTTDGSKVIGRLNAGKSKNNNGSITLNGGTYEVGEGQTVLHVNGECKASNITIKNATIISANDNGIQLNGAGTHSITGSKITGATAVYVKAGTVSISNSTLTATGAKAEVQIYNNGSVATGDAIVLDNCVPPYPAIVSVTIDADVVFKSANGSAVLSFAREGNTRQQKILPAALKTSGITEAVATEADLFDDYVEPSTDLPGASEVPADQKDAYNEWAAENGVTESTTTDTKVLATAYAMNVTLTAEQKEAGITIEEAAQKAVEDEVPSIDMNALVDGDLTAAVAAINTKYSGKVEASLVEVTEGTLKSTETAKFYKLSITINTTPTDN